jgi:hypothetical protein
MLASGIIIYRRRKGRQQMLQLTILGPANGSIAVAGAAVRFTAQTDPKQLAAKIIWSVADRPEVHGSGATFEPTFRVTGVERIVAQIPDLGLACDTIVYVFKTPSGGSTAADILRAEPPPVAREVAVQPQYGSHASVMGRAS